MATFRGGDVDTGTDETFDFLCSVCKKKHRNTEADKFCADCHDYYCSTCVKVHEDVPALQSHKILDKSQFQSGTSASFPAVPTERCKEHGHMPVNMYCKEHDVVGCPTCMVVKHSECKEKYYVPDYIIKTKRPDTRVVKEALKEIIKTVHVLKEELMNEKKRVTGSRDTVLETIQDFRVEINQRLDELEQNAIQQAEQEIQTLSEEIEAKLRELQFVNSELETALCNLQSAEGNLSELFVRSKTAHEIVTRANPIVSHFSLRRDISLTVDVTFKKNSDLSTLLTEMQALGSLRTREDTRRLAEPERDIVFQKRTNIYSREPKQQQAADHSLGIHAVDRKKISVRVTSDKNACCITSACVLMDGTVIITDNTNKKLKRLVRPKYIVKDSCLVSGYPWQVCAIDFDEVAVTCWSRSLIHFVNVGRQMVKRWQISTDVSLYGLAYADGKLYVSDCDTSVYVYKVSGERLQQFDKDQYGSKLFSDIASLAVNSDISRIYVTDFVKGLLILDMSGKLVGQFSGDDLQGAFGVCMYKNGTVLLTGKSSQNVLQFCKEGKLIKEIVKGNGNCQAICCDSNYNKLFIGFHDKDEIEIYDLS